MANVEFSFGGGKPGMPNLAGLNNRNNGTIVKIADFNPAKFGIPGFPPPKLNSTFAINFSFGTFNARQTTSLPAILRPSFPHCNSTTISCSAFLLTPKPFRRKIPPSQFISPPKGNPRTGEGGHRRTNLCNIFPAGRAMHQPGLFRSRSWLRAHLSGPNAASNSALAAAAPSSCSAAAWPPFRMRPRPWRASAPAPASR